MIIKNNRMDRLVKLSIKVYKNVNHRNLCKVNISSVNKKGSNSSISGKRYELDIYNIVKNCKLNNNYFNTQKENELGGCNSKNDIECKMDSTNIPIEIKRLNTPDWMQCSLKYDYTNKKWIGSLKNKIPEKSKIIFEKLISDKILFNNKIPEFMTKDLVYSDWLNIKKNTTDYNDIYFDCPNDTIKNLYREKGCIYIQISDKGLYHLGEDLCKFNVPEFICEQKLRVRIKIHTTQNKNGFCKLSVNVACQPQNLKNLIDSSYSLDDIKNLPKNLLYSG